MDAIFFVLAQLGPKSNQLLTILQSIFYANLKKLALLVLPELCTQDFCLIGCHGNNYLGN